MVSTAFFKDFLISVYSKSYLFPDVFFTARLADIFRFSSCKKLEKLAVCSAVLHPGLHYTTCLAVWHKVSSSNFLELLFPVFSTVLLIATFKSQLFSKSQSLFSFTSSSLQYLLFVSSIPLKAF